VQSASGWAGDPGDQAVPVDIRAVAHLIPAARAARATLARDGRRLSRDNLADAMRDDGSRVSNARASLLLKILKSEEEVTTIGLGFVAACTSDPEPLSEVVA
jgi:hypothetical protein